MMAQNTSTAVMASRKSAPHALDFFPTPLWATRALCEHVLPDLARAAGVSLQSVWEPAAGEGHMASALKEYFDRVHTSDIYSDYAYPVDRVHDFLGDGLLAEKMPFGRVNWVITNPPFNKASEFVGRALSLSDVGCAMLVRTAFAESVNRYLTLFQIAPPVVVAQFTERVPMVKGRVDKKASSATAYAWYVWLKDYRGPTRMVWIPPCRKALERPGDYDTTPAPLKTVRGSYAVGGHAVGCPITSHASDKKTEK